MPIHPDEPSIQRVISRVYIGNHLAVADEEILKEHNIVGIINCTPDDYSRFGSSLNNQDCIAKLQIPIRNKPEYRPIFREHLQHILPFIKEHSRNTRNILIFCKNGHRRSACVVIYYLMKRYGLSKSYATKFLKNIRPHILPEGSITYFYDDI